MGFDWRAFAEGFATTAAANIKEKGKEARDYRLEQEQLAKDNIMKISRRNSVVNEVLGLTNYLEDQGVSTSQMQAAIASGPQAIQDLSTKVRSAVEANGGRKLSDTEVDMIIKLPEGFKAIDMDMDQYVRNTYGLGLETKGATAEKPDIGFFDRLTGEAAMMRSKYKLASDVIYDGYTAEDINMLARQQEYEAIQPSTYAVIADLKRYDLQAKLDLVKNIASLKKDKLFEDIDYENAVEELTKLKERGRLTVNKKTGLTILEQEAKDSPDDKLLQNELAGYISAKNKVRSIEMPIYKAIYDDAIDTYGISAFEDLETSMLTNVDEEYVESIRELLFPGMEQASSKLFEDIEFNVTKSDSEGNPLEVKTDGGNTYTPESEGWNVLVQHLKKEETSETIDTTSAVDEQTTEVLGETPIGPVEKQALKTLNLKEIDTTENVVISEPKTEDPVEKKVELEPPKTTRKVEEVTETAEEMGIRKAANFMDRDRVTFEEWDEMGPNARKLLGLPTTKVGAQNAVENGFIELPQGKVKRETIAARMAELEPGDEIRSLRDKTKQLFGATDEEIQEGMDAGSITELDLSVLSDSGEEIFKYMQEQGLDENSEAFDIMRSLSEWADENNKRLPYNMGFLTLQFQKAFRR